MASLLASWVNDALKLPTKVTKFESDCANGIVFYQVLKQLGLLQEQEELNLAPKTSSAGRRSNLRAIAPLLRSKLRVSLSDTDITHIATEQRGVAAKVLFLMKEHYEHQTAPKKAKNLGGLLRRETKLPRRQRAQRDEFIDRCLQEGMTQAQIAMELHLKQFRDTQVQTEELAKTLEEAEVAEEKEEEAVRRQELRQTMQERRQFKEEWEATGRKNWAANQRTKREREKKELAFELSMMERNLIQKENARRAAKRDMHESLEEFERNMKRMGIDIGAGEVDIGAEEEEDAFAKARGKVLTTPTVALAKDLPGGRRQLLLEESPSEYLQRMDAELAFQFDKKAVKSYETKLKYRMQVERTAKKEKETRLRKADVDQARIQRSIAEKVSFEEKLGELLELSANERTAAAQVWELRQKKRARELEGLRWAAKREMQRTQAMEKFVEADVKRIRQRAEEQAEDRSQFMQTLRQSVSKKTAKKAAAHKALGRETVDMLLDLCEHVYPFVDNPASEEDRGIPYNTWAALKQQFIDGSIARKRLEKETEQLQERLAEAPTSVWTELFQFPPEEYGRCLRQCLDAPQVDLEEELLDHGDEALGRKLQAQGPGPSASPTDNEYAARPWNDWACTTLAEGLPPYDAHLPEDLAAAPASNWSACALKTLSILSGLGVSPSSADTGAEALSSVPLVMLRAAVVGEPLTGKSTLAAALAVERQLQVLSPAALLAKAMAAYAEECQAHDGELPPPSTAEDIEALSPRARLEYELKDALLELGMLGTTVTARGIGESRDGLDAIVEEVSDTFTARRGGGKGKGGKGKGKGGKGSKKGEEDAVPPHLHEPLLDSLRGTTAFTMAMLHWVLLTDFDCRRLHGAYAASQDRSPCMPLLLEESAAKASGAALGGNAAALYDVADDADAVPGASDAAAGAQVPGVGGWVLDDFPAAAQEVAALDVALQARHAWQRLPWAPAARDTLTAMAAGEWSLAEPWKMEEERKAEVEAAAGGKGKKGKGTEEVDVEGLTASRMAALAAMKAHGLDLVLVTAPQPEAQRQRSAACSINARTSEKQETLPSFVRPHDSSAGGGGKSNAIEGTTKEGEIDSEEKAAEGNMEAAEGEKEGVEESDTTQPPLPEGHVAYPLQQRLDAFTANFPAVSEYFAEALEADKWGRAQWVPLAPNGKQRTFGIADEAIDAWDAAEAAQRSTPVPANETASGEEGSDGSAAGKDSGEGAADAAPGLEESAEGAPNAEDGETGAPSAHDDDAKEEETQQQQGDGHGNEGEAAEESGRAAEPNAAEAAVTAAEAQENGRNSDSSGAAATAQHDAFRPALRAMLLKRALRRGLKAGDAAAAAALLRRWVCMKAGQQQGISLLATALRALRAAAQRRLTWALRTFVKEMRKTTAQPPRQPAPAPTASVTNKGLGTSSLRPQGSILARSSKQDPQSQASLPPPPFPGKDASVAWGSMGSLLPFEGGGSAASTAATESVASAGAVPLDGLQRMVVALEDRVAQGLADLHSGKRHFEAVEEALIEEAEAVEARLWDDAEARRDRCNALLEGYRSDGWKEQQCQAVEGIGTVLLRLLALHSQSEIQALSDYYCEIDPTPAAAASESRRGNADHDHDHDESLMAEVALTGAVPPHIAAACPRLLQEVQDHAAVLHRAFVQAARRHDAHEPAAALRSAYVQGLRHLTRSLRAVGAAVLDMAAACDDTWSTAFAWLKQRIQHDNSVISGIGRAVRECLRTRRAPSPGALLPPRQDSLGSLAGFGVWWGADADAVLPLQAKEEDMHAAAAHKDSAEAAAAAVTVQMKDSSSSSSSSSNKPLSALVHDGLSAVLAGLEPMTQASYSFGLLPSAAATAPATEASNSDWAVAAVSAAMATAAAQSLPPSLPPSLRLPSSGLLYLSSSILRPAAPPAPPQRWYTSSHALAAALAAAADSGHCGPVYAALPAAAWEDVAAAAAGDARKAVLAVSTAFFAAPPSLPQLWFSALSAYRVARLFASSRGSRASAPPAQLSCRHLLLDSETWQHMTLWCEAAPADAAAWLRHAVDKEGAAPVLFATSDTGVASLNYVQHGDDRRRYAALAANAAPFPGGSSSSRGSRSRSRDLKASSGGGGTGKSNAAAASQDWAIHLEAVREALWRGWSVPHVAPASSAAAASSSRKPGQRHRSKHRHREPAVVNYVDAVALLLDLACVPRQHSDASGLDMRSMRVVEAQGQAEASGPVSRVLLGGGLLRAWLVLCVLLMEEELGPKDRVEEWSSMAEWQAKLKSIRGDPCGTRLPLSLVLLLLQHWERPAAGQERKEGSAEEEEASGPSSASRTLQRTADAAGFTRSLSYAEFAACCGVAVAGVPAPLPSLELRQALQRWCAAAAPGVLPAAHDMLVQHL